jgi:hypothetical protein
MTDENEMKLLITLCILSFIILFIISVYAQSHKVKCHRGADGPQGSTGDLGLTGDASTGASPYLLGNSLNSILLAPIENGTIQRLPSVGIPWRTFNTNGDSSLFTFMFNIDDPTPNIALQAKLFFTVNASFTDIPFRSEDPKQEIKLVWDRKGTISKVPNVIIMLTRNNHNSLIITIIQGATWAITGGETDVTSSNIIVTDLNFSAQDMFVMARADIPISSLEKVVCYSSTVQFIK